MNQYISVDLGAESGRVTLGEVTKSNIVLNEVHRFSNSPVEKDGSLRWDFDKIINEIKKGIKKAVRQSSEDICGIGVDSWGVDFGLINNKGQLIENPYHYRDSRTDGMMEKAFEIIPKDKIYEATGIQFMQLNTIYQLLSMKLNDSDALRSAQKLIFMADLVSYHLCAEPYAEYTLASTSQLMDMKTAQWSQEIFNKLMLPISLMPKVTPPGTVVGKMKKEVSGEIGCGQIPLIAVGSHDTASAVASVPVQDENWAYISSGTWSLMGVEVPSAIISDRTYKYGFTNEGGVEDTIRLLKNIMGLWLVQDSRRQWQQAGNDLSYARLTELARKARPFEAFINPNEPDFLSPGDMPKRINEYLSKTGQDNLADKGQIVRVILESLALNYRWVLERIEEIIGKSIDVLHIVGGGVQNELLSQFAANATGKKVIAGPVEATATGNILMQAVAAGQIDSIQQGRDLVRNSFDLKEYYPSDSKRWDGQYQKMKSLFAAQEI